jgi:hypothetical protein
MATGPDAAAGRPGAAARNTEYRIAHLQERLVGEELAELGMRIEARGDTVHITGTAPTADERAAILRLAAEELPDMPVRADITLADASPPDHTEEIS